jgi:hypothetical protein
MIPVFKTDTLRNPMAYNGLTINVQNGGTDGEQQNIIEVTKTSAHTTIRTTQEARQNTEGLLATKAYKAGRVYLIEGFVRHSTYGGLHDLVASLAAAYDPGYATHQDQTNFGFLAFDFDVPTADDVTYPSGFQASRIYARAMSTVEPIMDDAIGLAAPFDIQLLLREPVRYLQTAESRTGAGTLTMKGNHPSWPTVTITMSGAGNAAFAIGNSTEGKTLTLNLSGMVNNDIVVVDMLNRRITKNGVEDMTSYVSGDYWHVHHGANTITVANGTNASAVVSARSAFAF